MRILAVTSFEYPSNVAADSSFTLTYRLLSELGRRGHYSRFVLPRLDLHDSMWHRALTPLPELPRGEYVYVPVYSGWAASSVIIPKDVFELFNPTFGKMVDYDVIVTNNGLMAGRLYQLFSCVAQGRHTPPIVVFEYNTPTGDFSKSDNGYLKDGDGDRRVGHFYAGYLSSERVVCFTDWAKRIAEVEAVNVFSSALARKIRKRLVVVPALFSRDGVDAAVAKIGGKHEKLTFYFGGRFTGGKNVGLILEVVDYLFSSGRDVDMVVTAPVVKVAKSKMAVGPYEKFPSQVKVYKGLSQDEAWRVMGKCHVSIFPQSLRAGPAAPLEQLRAGLIVLINRKDSAGVLPEDYPWFWETREELEVLVRRVLANYPVEVEKQARWREFVGAHRSIEAHVETLQGVLEEVVEERRRLLTEYRGKGLSEVISGIRDGMRWSEFLRERIDSHSIYLAKKKCPALRMAGLNSAGVSRWGLWSYLAGSGLVEDDSVSDPVLRAFREEGLG